MLKASSYTDSSNPGPRMRWTSIAQPMIRCVTRLIEKGSCASRATTASRRNERHGGACHRITECTETRINLLQQPVSHVGRRSRPTPRPPRRDENASPRNRWLAFSPLRGGRGRRVAARATRAVVCRISQRQPCDSILDQTGVEIDEETQPFPTDSQVRENLRFEDRMGSFHAFDFEEHEIV